MEKFDFKFTVIPGPGQFQFYECDNFAEALKTARGNSCYTTLGIKSLHAKLQIAQFKNGEQKGTSNIFEALVVADREKRQVGERGPEVFELDKPVYGVLKRFENGGVVLVCRGQILKDARDIAGDIVRTETSFHAHVFREIEIVKALIKTETETL